MGKGKLIALAILLAVSIVINIILLITMNDVSTWYELMTGENLLRDMIDYYQGNY